MAVPHFSVGIVARGSGRSAVMSAAYRHCARMDYGREGRTVDYRAKQGLAHEEFALPANVPQWLRAMIADRSVAGASEAFWNRVEAFEKRSDAQLAKDVTMALPIELSGKQNIALVRDFVERHITSRGMVADWVIHDNPGNPHVHLMMTLRPLTVDGFGPKKIALAGEHGKPLRNDAGRIVYALWAGSTGDFNAFREGWFACQNRHLALAGLDLRVDGRSFEKQGIELTPTVHLGVGAKAIERKTTERAKARSLERRDLQEERRAQNARRIARRPEIVLDLITREKSVFDERDVARALHRYIDDAPLFQSLMVRILQSPETLCLTRERIDFATGNQAPAKYTTRALIRLEAQMGSQALWLDRQSSHDMRDAVLQQSFDRHARLSEEQRTAIAHVSGPERISAVIGRAGAGKTTMMKAAREAWEAAGYRVVGGALAGKAAEGLSNEAGIASRTLSSWELAWSKGRNQLDARCVFVLDEAGMVSSRQMGLIVDAVTRAGAKLVLVGDPEQLQPIEAGAPFRAIADRIGYAELETVYRQREQWMRDASLDLARGRVGKAVEAYRSYGRLIGAELKDQAVNQLIADWNRDYDPSRTALILAHLRRDVAMLNEMARAKLVERGLIAEGFVFKTQDGERRFAAGDQIVFLKNDSSLGVKNGLLGRVLEAAPNRITAEIGMGEHRRQVVIESRFYGNLDHGYATTIHKAQGATVDRVKVLASLSLDRHLAYVAMTRHREDLAVYYGRRSFTKVGGLVPILSRRNAKETTLDYERGALYAQALRFAEARGLHFVHVARTLVRDRLEWTVRQRQRLVDLANRLATISARLGLIPVAKTNPLLHSTPDLIREAEPTVAGITTFAKTIEQVVAEKLEADTALKRQWEDVSTRFLLVYAAPEAAFKAVNVDAMLTSEAVATSMPARIGAEPLSFGALKGKTGLLASRADKEARQRALKNVPILVDSLENYLRLRESAERLYRGEELARRQALSIDIPALSARAGDVLERVRDAIDRDDLPVALAFTLADGQIKAELDRFAKAVCERFGERTFLSIAAGDADGETFQTLTLGMGAGQKAQVQQAWNAMRAVQKLAAHERRTIALEQAEALRQTRALGLSL
ncbi:MAG: Ti-type conjugative transfer relaxase TraA [Hydrogenophaga sp.]|nr:Ti-type conjugative transfer relaxase TraA [Hydrogenophaga sp.]